MRHAAWGRDPPPPCLRPTGGGGSACPPPRPAPSALHARCGLARSDGPGACPHPSAPAAPHSRAAGPSRPSLTVRSDARSARRRSKAAPWPSPQMGAAAREAAGGMPPPATLLPSATVRRLPPEGGGLPPPEGGGLPPRVGLRAHRKRPSPPATRKGEAPRHRRWQGRSRRRGELHDRAPVPAPVPPARVATPHHPGPSVPAPPCHRRGHPVSPPAADLATAAPLRHRRRGRC